MIRADIAVAVRRHATTGVVMSIKREDRGRHGLGWPPNVLEQSLDIRRSGRVMSRWRLGLRVVVRIARQTPLLELLLWRDIRQGPQVLIQTDGTHHPNDVRCL